MADLRARPALKRWEEQQGAQEVGDKSRKDQQNPAEQGGESGALKVNRPDPVASQRSEELVEVGAPRTPEQNHANYGGGEARAHGPKPADCQRRQNEGRDLRQRQRQQADKAPFNQRHDDGHESWIDEVGVTAGIVYGRLRATTYAAVAGARHWISFGRALT